MSVDELKVKRAAMVHAMDRMVISHCISMRARGLVYEACVTGEEWEEISGDLAQRTDDDVTLETICDDLERIAGFQNIVAKRLEQQVRHILGAFKGDGPRKS